MLDIGGGFPGNPVEHNMLASFAEVINGTIKSYFSSIPDLEVIAEPGKIEVKMSSYYFVYILYIGRYFATSPFIVLMRIMGKGSYHDTDENGQTRKHYKYYFTDGNLGIFNYRELFEEMDPKPVQVRLEIKCQKYYESNCMMIMKHFI